MHCSVVNKDVQSAANKHHNVQTPWLLFKMQEGLKTLQGYLNFTGDVSLWTLLDQETSTLDANRIRSEFTELS